MCLIVACHRDNPNAYFRECDLDESLKRNQDGIGVMYAVKDKNGVSRLRTFKSLGNKEQKKAFFYEHLKKARENDSDFAAHMRLTTHGETDLLNCHPHKILDMDDGDAKDLYLMHNGVLSNTGADTHYGWSRHTGPNATAKKTDEDEKSDTRMYIEKALVPMLKKAPTGFKNQGMRWLIEHSIGTSNKFVMMDDLGKLYYFNKEQGAIHNGMWLSNKHSIYTPPSYNTAGKYVGGAGKPTEKKTQAATTTQGCAQSTASNVTQLPAKTTTTTKRQETQSTESKTPSSSGKKSTTEPVATPITTVSKNQEWLQECCEYALSTYNLDSSRKPLHGIDFFDMAQALRRTAIEDIEWMVSWYPEVFADYIKAQLQQMKEVQGYVTRKTYDSAA